MTEVGKRLRVARVSKEFDGHGRILFYSPHMEQTFD
jgi:hypothetical protein